MTEAGSAAGGRRKGPPEADPCIQDVGAGSLFGGLPKKDRGVTQARTQPEQGVQLGFDH